MRFAAAAMVAAALALVSAAPAGADDNETFLEVLEMSGVPTTDDASAIAMGHQVCDELRADVPVADAADTLIDGYSLAPLEAGLTVGFSVAAFCPELKHLVDDGE